MVGVGGSRSERGGWLPVAALLLVSAAWGVHSVVGVALERQLSPLQLTVARFSIGALLYTPLLPRLRRLPRSALRQLAVTGVLWAVLFPLFFYESLRYISPVESVLVINTSPLIAALLGRIFLQEKLRTAQAVGLLIGFAGVGVAVAGSWSASGSLLGLLLIALASATFAGYTLSARSLVGRLPVVEMVAAISIVGALELWTITLATGNAGLVVEGVIRLNTSGWIELGYVAIVVSTLSYVLYGYGLSHSHSSSAAALAFYPQVIFTALAQLAWFGTGIGWLTAVSAVLILGGVVVSRTSSRKPGISRFRRGSRSGAPV